MVVMTRQEINKLILEPTNFAVRSISLKINNLHFFYSTAYFISLPHCRATGNMVTAKKFQSILLPKWS